MLNWYHLFTPELNDKKFLHTQIMKVNNKIKTTVFIKKSMYPVYCSSKVSFWFKKNPINGELHKARKIASSFQSETARTKAKFLKAVFLGNFIVKAINNFNNADEELVIPKWFFNERKTVVINWTRFSKKIFETFLLEYYKNDKSKFNIIWATSKIKSLS